jgi:hypothetical protein
MHQREILVAKKNPVTADGYVVSLEGAFEGVRVTPCRTLDDVRSGFRANPDSCCIIDFDLAGPNLKELLVDRATHAKRAQIILVGADPSRLPEGVDPANLHFLPPDADAKQLVARVENVFQLADLAGQYCKITPQSLRVRTSVLLCDVYMKIGDQKYVKVMNEGEKFGPDEFEKFFTQKKAKYLYLPRLPFLQLMTDVIFEAGSLTADPGSLTVDSAADATNAIFQSMQSLFEIDGFTPQVQQMTLVAVTIAVSTLKKNPKLSELLGKLDKNRDSFLSWHSTAVSLIACKLATALDWKSDSTFQKLALASMLHDLTLPRDELARYHDGCAPGETPTDADRALIKSHPADAAALVNGMPDVPGEVAFIVQQHHENADGTGYPKGVGVKDISPIAALFVISHDLVSAMYLEPPGEFHMERYLFKCESEKRFTKGAFGQVFRGVMAKLKDLG